MSILRSTTAATRRLGIFLALATVVSVSLVVYYFRLVPDNKEKLHRQGFLILNQDANGLCRTMDDLKYFFRNQWENDKTKILDTTFKRRSPFIYKVTEGKCKRHTMISNERNDPHVCLDLDGERAASFQFDASFGSIQYGVELDQLAKRILNTERPDLNFFTSYFIICQQHTHDDHHSGNVPLSNEGHADSSDEGHSDQHIFFHSDRLPVSFQMQSDTIGKMIRSIQFSRILSLEVSGEKFRAYMLPFQLEGHSLVLAGMINEKEYRKRLQDIPFETVSGILIAILLILISLPFLKIFLISPSEHYGIRDLLFLGISLFLGAALLLIMLQGTLMQVGAQKRIKAELHSLSDDIHFRFQNELTHSYEELKRIDLELNDELQSHHSPHPKINPKDSDKQGTSAQSSFVSQKIRTPEDDLRPNSISVKLNRKAGKPWTRLRHSYAISFYDSKYLNYSMVHWSDASGRQIFKGRLDNQAVAFSNVNRRQYFKDIKNGHLYSFLGPDKTTNSFSIEPVYSMSTNAFEVNISVPSCVDGMGCMVAAMSTQMSSLMNTDFPKGYGFYMVDDAGRILFQSAGEVTLRENFIERINDHKNLSNALRNRQSSFLNVQNINHESYKILVSPIDYLPWHLIVYHSNNDSNDSILHVAAFTSFFMLVLFAVLLTYFLLAWRSVNGFSRLRQRVYQYEWLKPAADKSTFLGAANLYLFSFVIYTLLCGLTVHNSSVLLFMGMLFPLFSIHTLFVLFRQHILSKRPFGSFTDSYNLFGLFFLLLFNYFYFQIDDGNTSAHLLLRYEAIAIMLSGFVIAIFPRLIKRPLHLDQRSLKLSYSSFWFFAVISISLFPVQSFFQYAQQNEIALGIKTRQLDLAQSMEARLLKFDWLDTISTMRTIPVEGRRSFLFYQGIYPVKDHVAPINTAVENYERGQRVGYLYEEVLKNMNWGCTLIDEMSEQDCAADQKWWRCDCPKSSPTQMTLLYRLKPESNNPGRIGGVNALAVGSILPDIASYYRIGNLKSYVVLLLISSGLLLIFFQLIKSAVARLFSVPHVYDKTIASHNDSFLNRILMESGYALHEEIEKVLKENEVKNVNHYESLKTVWECEYNFGNTNQEEEILEGRILFNQQHLSEFYEKIWKSCSDKEKYFLYDIAKDGFMNYKNSMLLQQLRYKEILVPNKGYGLAHRDGDDEIPQEGHGVRLMSVSFRNYILEKEKDAEITNLKNQFRSEGTWSKTRTPALIGITAVSIFLFITQQDLLQQVAALIPTLSGLLGLGSLILGSKSGAATPK